MMGSSLPGQQKIKLLPNVTDSGKHSSLFQYGHIKIYETGPRMRDLLLPQVTCQEISLGLALKTS